MKKLLLSALTIGLAIAASCNSAYAFAKGEQDCTKCHTLNAGQAKEVLKEIIPDVKILDIQNGPINGLWEVSLESGGKKSVLYIDYSKKTLVAGNILGIKTKTNYTQQSFDKINRIDYASIPLENSLVMGEKDAKHKIIVFDDPD
jgi:thiol:disulfide interchange protein DsbC